MKNHTVTTTTQSHKSLWLCGYLLGILALMLLTACSQDEPANELPNKLTEFVAEYYPNQHIASYQQTSSGYQVVITDGPTLTFDSAYAWTSINGNGSPLAQNLLYDQLPSKVYQYLETTSELNEVFSIARTSKSYTISLLDSTLTYDITTGEIRG